MKQQNSGQLTARFRPFSLTVIGSLMQWGIVKTRIFRHLVCIIAINSPYLMAQEIEIESDKEANAAEIIKLPVRGNLPASGILEDVKDGSTFGVYQITPDGLFTFSASYLNAGERVTLRIRNRDAAKPLKEKYQATLDGNQLKITFSGQPLVDYQTTARKDPRQNLDPKFLRGGYLRSIYAPGGHILTDDYAVNHLHHHGIWTAWTKTSYDGREPDFWNMGQGKGKVDFVSLEKTWSGPIHAGFISKHRHTDMTSDKPIDVLEETWKVTVFQQILLGNTIDLEIEQRVIGDKPLDLPVYHYGGLGIRGREEWNDPSALIFLTSEGLSDRNGANGKSADWLAMSGRLPDNVTGTILVLSHPSNPRAPQPARIHPKEPFVSFAPQTNESMSIRPGEVLRMKYRIIGLSWIDRDSDKSPSGKYTKSCAERLWASYTNSIKARWKD